MIKVVLAAGMALAWLPGCGSQPISPEAIAGTYSVTMTDEALAAIHTPMAYRLLFRDKQWIMEFAPDGVHHWSEVTPVGVVERSHVDIGLTDNEILFKKDHGELSCTERGKGYDFTEEGRCKWRLEGDQLTFELISDECQDRIYALVALPWIRQP